MDLRTILLPLLLLALSQPVSAQPVPAAVHAQPATGSTTSPAVRAHASGGPEGALFLATDAAYRSVDVAVDAQGGLHAAFMLWAYGDGHPVYYGYCPPADLDACNRPEAWTLVQVSDDMPFVQLELTPAGQPRLLLYNDGYYVENQSATWYRYAECDANCTAAPSWKVIDLGATRTGGGLYTTDYSAHSFRLDPQGRPRFVYYYDSNYVGEPRLYEYLAYLDGCNADCTDRSNWWSVQLPDYAWTDDLRKAALAFTPEGLPRLITIADSGTRTFLVYFECNDGCDAREDWSEAIPIVEIGSGSGHRSWTLQVDSRGRSRIAVSPLGQPIHYFWCDAGCTSTENWQGYWVRFGDNDAYPVLALDANDRPRLAFKLGANLGYAWCEANCESMAPSWLYVTAEEATVLDRELSVPITPDCVRGAWIGGYRPSLALDAAGHPRIGYDGEFLMECYRYPNDPRDPTTYTEAKWWTSRLVFFPHPGGDTGTDAEPETGLPTAIVLEPNYPNPFNPQTTLAFSLSDAGPVRLAVFDPLGREVAVLLDETRAAGRHEVVWQAGDRPGGLYFYHLQTGEGTLTRAMTLLK